MSFQAYLINIQEKTGKTPEHFKQMAAEKGFTENGTIKKEVKAWQIVQWLKDDFQLGHGHALAIVALLKGAKDENSA